MPLTKKKKATKPAAVVSDAPKSIPTGETGTYEAYCVKCKEKGVKFEGEVFVNGKGSKIAKGKHTKCGTTVCRILGRNA